MKLTDQIIEHGPFVAGEPQPDWMRSPKATDYNELRNELIAAREARERFQVEGIGLYGASGDLSLRCGRCPWTLHTSARLTLAELNRRADEHGEECR